MEQGTYGQHARHASVELPKKSHKLRNTILILLGIIIVAVIAVVVACMLYLQKLDSIMDLGSDKQEIESVLVEPTPGEPFYVLLIGSDSREGSEESDYQWAHTSLDGSDAHSDVTIVARIDEEAHQITLLSIPRDTPAELPEGGIGKLNQTYMQGGIPAIVDAVTGLTGLPISHVVEIQMSGLMQLVDTLGGIQVDVPVAIDYHEALTFEPIHLDPGVQILDGAQTEVFARERLAYGEAGDMMRQAMVRQIVEAILDKIKSVPLLDLPETILSCAECVKTDFTALEAIQVVLSLGRDVTIYQGTGPSRGDLNLYSGEQWLCYEDPEGWARVVALIESGADPGTVSYDGDEVFIAGAPAEEARVE